MKKGWYIIIDSFNGVELKYTIIRWDKTRQGTIFGNAIGGFVKTNATGECQDVCFNLKTNGVILINKEGEVKDKVIIRFLIIAL